LDFWCLWPKCKIHFRLFVVAMDNWPALGDSENSPSVYTSDDGITLVCQSIFGEYCCCIIIHHKPTHYYDWPTDRPTGRRANGSRNSRGETVARIRATRPSEHGCSSVDVTSNDLYIYIYYIRVSVCILSKINFTVTNWYFDPRSVLGHIPISRISDDGRGGGGGGEISKT
jgi:hypothetical protein